MENLAFEFARALERAAPTRVVALGRSQRNLVWFLPFAALRTLFAVLIERVPTVLIGDPVVLLALWPVVALRRRLRVVVVVHGLDLTLPKQSYRALVRRALRRADEVIAISHATAREAAGMGVHPERIEVVPPGLPVPSFAPGDEADRRTALQEAAHLRRDQVVVSTLGRLTPRKGQAWFAGAVLPLLPEHYVYVVAGTGPDRDAIARAAERAGVSTRCVLLGLVDDELREALLSCSDVFAVPNIAVPGDMEGFGLVAAEASLRGADVVSARLQGLTDAVIEGETGTLCEPGDAAAFAEAVRDIVEGARTRPDRRSIAAAAALHFGTERFDRDVARFLDRTAHAVEAGSRRVGHRSHALLDVASRRRKAQKLITLLRRRRPLEGSLLLEVGTGSGVMAADLAVAVGPDGRVVSVDVCDERVTSQGFDFVPVVDTHLPFPDASFDVVVSNHVFEHVGGRNEQLNHLREMLRVLRPDGLAYLATPNRWGLLEPHYRLPLLSWLPARAASAYLRATRRGDIYDVRSPSRRTLHEIARDAGFIAHECSIEAMRVLAEIEDPALAVRVIARAPTAMLRLGLPVVPTMVFVMRRAPQH